MLPGNGGGGGPEGAGGSGSPPRLTASRVLIKGQAILEERAREYEKPGGERSTAKIVAAFNAITGRDGERGLSETEGWLFLRLLKDVRFFSTARLHEDSGVDAVNYTALMVESKAREEGR